MLGCDVAATTGDHGGKASELARVILKRGKLPSFSLRRPGLLEKTWAFRSEMLGEGRGRRLKESMDQASLGGKGGGEWLTSALKENLNFPLSISRLCHNQARFIYVLALESAVITTSGQRQDVKVYAMGGNIADHEQKTIMREENPRLPEVVEAVIFDLDDTLVTSTVDYTKFKTLVIQRISSYGNDEGLYSPNETIVAILGRFEDRMRVKGVPDSEIRRRLSEMDEIMDSVELERVSETTPIAGAGELLRMLRERGIKVGILTRGCDKYASEALSLAGLLKYVDAIECRNSHTKPKPSPESYLKLVVALGVKKESTVFVGDHPIDAQCAANAGVPFVAVSTGDVPEEMLREAGSVEVFQNVGQMIEWFARLLEV